MQPARSAGPHSGEPTGSGIFRALEQKGKLEGSHPAYGCILSELMVVLLPCPPSGSAAQRHARLTDRNP